MLNNVIGQTESWHASTFVRSWLGPLPVTRRLIIAVLVMVLIAVFVNVQVRYDQGQVWKASPEVTEIDGAMSFSTADAPYFLGQAAAAKKGLSPGEYERNRAYPQNETAYQQRKDALSDKRPLLSQLISWLSLSHSPKELLTASHTILLITSGLTALMITLAFGVTGYWLEGAVAAVGGGLSSAYLVRSSFGRIDTDQLNLGLMYLMFALVMLSAKSRTAISSIIWAISAGIIAKIFMAWYGKPELIWLAMAAYLWLLLAMRKEIKVAILCLLAFYALTPFSLLISPPVGYLQDSITAGNFLFPNIVATITETARVSLAEILISLAGSVEMGLVCLIGLVLWGIRHPVMAVAYGPLSAFALLNFVLGNRAIFYSAPFFWFGAGFLITSATRFIVCTAIPSSNSQKELPPIKQFASIASAALAMIIAWLNSPTDYVPRPSFSKPILQGLTKINGLAEFDSSVVASWWDYGYASLFLNQLPTLHDGGSHSQTGPTTHFFAYAMLSPDQSETTNILRFLSINGKNELRNYETKRDLFARIEQPTSEPVPEIFLVLTNEMAGWIGSISKLANWDIETGDALIPQNNNGKEYVNYIRLGCDYRGFPVRFACGNISFDFDRGLMNDAPTIVGWARARDGFAQDVRRYSADATFGVQSLQIDNRLSSQLMHRQLYDSSFNKLYHLGLIEAPGITLVYDNYPHIRIYRIAGTD